MLSQDEIANLVKDQFPGSSLGKVGSYQGNYLVQVFFNDPEEGDYDPFYLLDSSTQQFTEFSVMTDGTFEDVMDAMAFPLWDGDN